MFIVYTTKNCFFCKEVKKFLAGRKIEFDEIDIEEVETAKELLMEKGYIGVPVIEINGEFIEGFNKKAILKALNLKK